MKTRITPWHLVVLGIAVAAVSCQPDEDQNESAGADGSSDPEGALAQIGSFILTESDLDLHLQEAHSGSSDEAARKSALDALVKRARFAQAALDADLDEDPVVRAEIARILSNRYRETVLFPKFKEAATPIPEARLRELYAAEQSRFRSDEKRQAAVLWLNPKNNPERAKQYADKLASARDWFQNNADLKDHPEQGFSVLAVDHSEHQVSRYKGGDAGWLERDAGGDTWKQAVAEIVFSLETAGEVSEVVSRPEGVFLVRYMALQPAVQRPFESVAAELERQEQNRARAEAEREFNEGVEEKYPARRLPPPSERTAASQQIEPSSITLKTTQLIGLSD